MAGLVEEVKRRGEKKEKEAWQRAGKERIGGNEDGLAETRGIELQVVFAGTWRLLSSADPVPSVQLQRIRISVCIYNKHTVFVETVSYTILSLLENPLPHLQRIHEDSQSSVSAIVFS